MTKEASKQFKQQSFVRWYDTIPWKQLTIVNCELQKRLGVTRQTISNYYNGKTEIPDMAVPTINQVAEHNVFATA